eukprot:365157-Chlamydomonas_euryale.AAC.36
MPVTARLTKTSNAFSFDAIAPPLLHRHTTTTKLVHRCLRLGRVQSYAASADSRLRVPAMFYAGLVVGIWRAFCMRAWGSSLLCMYASIHAWMSYTCMQVYANVRSHAFPELPLIASHPSSQDGLRRIMPRCAHASPDASRADAQCTSAGLERSSTAIRFGRRGHAPRGSKYNVAAAFRLTNGVLRRLRATAVAQDPRESRQRLVWCRSVVSG